MTKTSTTKVENAANVLAEIADDASRPVVNTTLNPERPSAEWTLEELGAFANKTLRKSAEVSWELGRSLVLAKEKANRQFEQWAKLYVPELKTRTRQRYMAVGRLDYDDVKGKSVSEIYTLLWGDSHTKGKRPVSAQASEAINSLTKLLNTNADELLQIHREKLKALHTTLTDLLMG